ncbi:MAG: hypothetical protein GEV03_04510 [Streptosporangiales bacterium]|nr:hypothetical protein [Streptosporangiales bacterium]
MTLGDPTPQYGSASFTEPTSHGYIYLGMRVAPPRRGPFVRKSTKRNQAVETCHSLARRLEILADVVAATVYRAVLIPPVKGSLRFDVLVLIQTISPEAIPTVEAAEAYRQLDADFIMRARNIRRIGDVDLPRSGTFLFNHFSAADPERALRTWENFSGWFTDKAGADDAALLQPIDETAYVFVNHVRLPCGPIRFLLRFAKPSFRKYVTANLKANQIRNAPVFCKTV